MRPNGMDLKLERGDDAEIAAAAAHAPEQVSVLTFAGGVQYTVGGDDVNRGQVVEAQAVLAAQPAKPAGQGQAADAGRRNEAAGRRQPVDLRFAVEVTQVAPP